MEQRKMELVDRIGVFIKDEISARDSYRDLAGILRARDYLVEARQVSLIADEKDVHANLLMTVLQSIKEKPGEIMMSGRMIEVPLGRPVPQTYGDWVNLAEDIKEKYLSDASTREWTNKALQHIADEDELADESKRWLVAKLANWV